MFTSSNHEIRGLYQGCFFSEKGDKTCRTWIHMHIALNFEGNTTLTQTELNICDITFDIS